MTGLRTLVPLLRSVLSLTVIAAVTAGLLLVPAPAGAAPRKPTPAPFPAGAIATVYSSDVSSHGLVYTDVVDGFTELQKNHPAVMRQNLDTVIAVNNAAAGDRALVNRALADEHDDLLVTMSDALGEELGELFRKALADGRLPKTEQLLSGSLARGGGLASSTFAEKLIFDYDRPFVVAPKKINEYHRAGEEGPYDDDPLSKAFPSGHTNQATWKAMLWALAVPEFAAPLLVRAQEVGYNRLVMGVHYPLDVIGGRMTGLAAAADRWNDPRFRPLILAVGDEIRAELQWRCGAKLAVCIADDTPYLGSAQRQAAVSAQRMNYDFTRIHRPAPMVVPEAAVSLLERSRPELSASARRTLLRESALPGGYPLDDRSARGSWQRLDLVRALLGS